MPDIDKPRKRSASKQPLLLDKHDRKSQPRGSDRRKNARTATADNAKITPILYRDSLFRFCNIFHIHVLLFPFFVLYHTPAKKSSPTLCFFSTFVRWLDFLRQRCYNDLNGG